MPERFDPAGCSCVSPAHFVILVYDSHGSFCSCLQGGLSEAEQQPDADLGKSVREGWRNINPDSRAFGVPSIRTDVALPKVRCSYNTHTSWVDKGWGPGITLSWPR